jgi:hypothetical protein
LARMARSHRPLMLARNRMKCCQFTVRLPPMSAGFAGACLPYYTTGR